jgi:SAM-dependent methyltransferase/uncharacterized protein YbaR (Trm112 family)
MNERIILDFLRCPACGDVRLEVDAFRRDDESVEHGVVICRQCATWYRLEDGLLELLVPALRIPGSDSAFALRMLREFGRWDYGGQGTADAAIDEHKLGQKTFYDEDASSYETGLMQLPFWQAFDRGYTRAIEEFAGGRDVMVEIGGGSGRQSIPLRRSFGTILSFDISEAMVRRAMRRLRETSGDSSNVHYFVADAENIPVRTSCADAAVFSGILHHVASPETVLRETARTLRPGGRFAGMENNRTVLRPLFDLLMSVSRLWNEKAHPEHFIIGGDDLRRWFREAGLVGAVWTSVFLPPHLFSLFPGRSSDRLLRASDGLGRALPGIRNQGGLVLFTGEKPFSSSPASSVLGAH